LLINQIINIRMNIIVNRY